MLASCCVCETAKENALLLSPYTEKSQVISAQQETDAANGKPAQDQVAVVTPETTVQVTEVTPPAAAKPVEIDQLVKTEPLPTLEDEKAMGEGQSDDVPPSRKEGEP